jgi:phospholipid transport system substrate-binding protein
MKGRKNVVGRVFDFMILLLVSFLVLPGSVQAAEASVTRAVQGTEESQTAAFYQVEQIAQSVLQVLESDASHEQKHKKITRIADENFAFDTIAKLSLARNWRNFSPAEQEEFVVLFREFLAKRYGGQFDTYDGDTVSLVGERTEPRGDQTVQTELIRVTGVKVAIDYRMRQREGKWQVIDVTIEGVSLVSSFRSQFRDILKTGTPQDLLSQLREKNATS